MLRSHHSVDAKKPMTPPSSSKKKQGVSFQTSSPQSASSILGPRPETPMETNSTSSPTYSPTAFPHSLPNNSSNERNSTSKSPQEISSSSKEEKSQPILKQRIAVNTTPSSTPKLSRSHTSPFTSAIKSGDGKSNPPIQERQLKKYEDELSNLKLFYEKKV